MRNWIRRLLLRWELKLRTVKPRPVDKDGVIAELGRSLAEAIQVRESGRLDYIERCHELVEARQMSGTGPWLAEGIRGSVDERGGSLTAGSKAMIGVRESNVGAQGAMGQLELDLQNIDWRREINLSWLEFSRWGIQQIILISRLYYIKNPIIRRLIDVDAAYVFGRGVEMTSDDEAVNDAIKEYLELNKVEFGHAALVKHQKRTNYDGNLFFVFFPDTQDTGTVPTRTIDATEIQDIITNPEDTTEEWYFRRTWSAREFDAASGTTQTQGHEAWYPSVFLWQAVTQPGSELVKLDAINGFPVMWDSPVMHQAYGDVGKWTFGCPPAYPALDWAKADRRYLENCATLAASHAQIALSISTKGGAQALAGIKGQLATTVGPTTQVFDTNPTANVASIFASGPGTELDLIASRGKALDPKEHREYGTMAAICFGVPPTWIGDMETANLATATTLDRPTEAGFELKQETWVELLTNILVFVLNIQMRAGKGKLREALLKKHGVINLESFRIVEKPKIRQADGRLVYVTEATRKVAKKPTDLEISVVFPPIREGDLPVMMGALIEAITLNGFEAGNGIDVKEGIKAALSLVNSFSNTNIDVEEVIEKLYPDAQYAPLQDRTAIMKAQQDAVLNPPAPAGPGVDTPDEGAPPQPVAVRKAHGKRVDAAVGEAALTRLGWAHERIARLMEARRGKKAA
jgi:hypothetical protein